jgi:hypothetical protein
MFIDEFFVIQIMFVYVLLHRCDFVYQVHIMGCVKHVGYATYRRVTVMIHLCLYKKK